MKWPEQNTRWSLVTRTLKRSAMMQTGLPGILGGQPYRTLAQKDEQASGDQIGGRARIAAVTFSPEPAVEFGQGGAAGLAARPTGLEHVPRSSRRFLRLGQAALAGDERVGMSSQQPQVAEDDGRFELAGRLQAARE